MSSIFQFSKRTATLLGLLAVGFVAAGFLWRGFSSHGRTDGVVPQRPVTAVVFTGQFDRVRLGLQLMENNRIDRLFITGVNDGAGINPKRFPLQFGLSTKLIDALAAGNIVLATDANSTIENAVESACWLRRQPSIKSIVLITSPYHMARASLALQRALPPGVSVTQLSADGVAQVMVPRRNSEFLKFAATWIFTVLPTSIWTLRHIKTCHVT